MNGSGDKGSNKSEKSTFSHLEQSLEAGRNFISDALSSVDAMTGEMNSLNGQEKRETEKDTMAGPPMLDKANNGIEGITCLSESGSLAVSVNNHGLFLLLTFT